MRDARQHVPLMERPGARQGRRLVPRGHAAARDISLISSMLGAALRGRDRDERAVLAKRALELLLPGLATTP